MDNTSKDQHLDWARSHKKAIAREFIRKVDHPSQAEPVGIFTAGVPGAGKTEFTQELLKTLVDPPLRIDMDEIAQLIEGYSPTKANLFRGGASVILAKIYDEITKARLDFIFDGTFAHDNAIGNLQRAVDHAYLTKLYYIHQVPEIAWNFTKDRELVEKRRIEKNGFIDTYLRLYKNIGELQESFKDVTISVIIKDKENKVGRVIEDVNNVFDHVPKPLDRDQLERVILD